MFAVKLPINSAVVCNRYIVFNMPSIFIFHISNTTWGIIDHSWNLSTTLKQVKLNCYGYVKFKQANQSCSTSKINQSVSAE